MGEMWLGAGRRSFGGTKEAQRVYAAAAIPLPHLPPTSQATAANRPQALERGPTPWHSLVAHELALHSDERSRLFF